MCVQDKRCTNLNEEGLCKLQILSTHSACRSHKLYPRLFVEYYNDLYAAATLSCPEIVNMVYDLATQPNSDNRLFLPPKQISSKIKSIPRKTPVHFLHTDVYLELLSFIERDQISDFLQKNQDLFQLLVEQRFVSHGIEPTMEDISKTTVSVIYHIQSEYLRHYILPKENINTNAFLEQTQHRFSLLPQETKEIIRVFFWKTFCIHSIFSLQNKSLKEAMLWQTIYMTFFFVLGTWNPNYTQVQSWKELVYRFGRFSHGILPIEEVPLIDVHTMIMPFFYETFYPSSNLSDRNTAPKNKKMSV